jgi:hypothetical protein
MKVAFDTNAIINLCASDELTSKVVEYFNTHSGDILYIVATVREELKLDNLDSHQLNNYERLMAAITADEQAYFAVGVSSIGGNDVIRGNGAGRIGIQRIILDSKSAYEQYSKERMAKGLPPQDSKTWLNRNINQADAVIFERAEELGCDYVVSDNKDILRAKNSTCRPIKLAGLVALL